MAVDINLERIFIHRGDQILIMNEAVRSWQHQMAMPANQGYLTNGQYCCIVWLSGGGGLGKSTLLKHYREELSASEPLFHVGKIIDWSFLANNDSLLRYFMTDNIDEITYIEMIYESVKYFV